MVKGLEIFREFFKEFINIIEKDPPDFAVLGKSVGIPKLSGEAIIEQIKKTFSV